MDTSSVKYVYKMLFLRPPHTHPHTPTSHSNSNPQQIQNSLPSNPNTAYLSCEENRVHYVTVSKLPVCFTILSYLPNKNETSSIPDHLHCLRHPKKKVKFFCESHNQQDKERTQALKKATSAIPEQQTAQVSFFFLVLSYLFSVY